MTEQEQLEHEIREADVSLAEITRSHDRLVEERDGLALKALRGDEGADARCREILDELGTLEHKRALANVVRNRAKVRMHEIRAEQRREAELEETRREQASQERMRAAAEHTRRIEREFSEELGRLGWFTTPRAQTELIADIEGTALARIKEKYGEHAMDLCRREVLPALGKDSGAAAGTGLAARAMS